MNKDNLFKMISLINDTFLHEAEQEKKLTILLNKKIIIVAASIVFIICSSTLIIYYSINLTNNSNNQVGTLEGGNKINPAVMYNGKIYYWKKMTGPIEKMPKGELPEGYEYKGDIKYVKGKKITKELQFIANFKAKGKLYYNTTNNNQVIICISTNWLKDAYVTFESK